METPILERDPLWSDEEYRFQLTRAEARQLVAEEMASNGDEPESADDPFLPQPEPQPIPVQITIRGKKPVQQRLWHGKAPGSVELKLKGLTVQVDGSFEKGERIEFSGTAVIVSEAARDKLDKHTKVPVEAVQVHDATILAFEVE